MIEEVRTAEELKKLQTRLEMMWADRNREIEFFRRLRFMEIKPKLPVAYEAHTVRLPKAHQIIERMTGMLTTEPITPTVPPGADTAKAKELSSKMEKWTRLMLEQLQKQIGEDNIERLVEHLLLDAHACMRVLYARNYWEDHAAAGKRYPRRKKDESDAAFNRRTRKWYPRRLDGESGEDYDNRTEEWKKGRPLPISWTVLDPLTVYPLFTEMGLACVLESDRRDIASLHPEEWQLKKESPELWELILTEAAGVGQVEFTQVWYPNSLVYAVNGEIVHRQEHMYGTPPYIYATGIGSVSRTAAKTGLSVLYGLRYVLPKQDEVLSQLATAVALHGWPTPVLTRSPNRPVGKDGTFDPIELIPGELFQQWPDEKLGFLEYQGAMPDVGRLLSVLMAASDQAGLSPVLFGVDPTGTSGYRLNQLIAAAKTKFKPIIRHAERALEQVIQAIWDILEYQVREPLYVYGKGKGDLGWIGLGPDDLNGYRQVQVKLNPIMPSDSYAKSSMIIGQVERRLLDRRSAIEKLGNEQPEEILDAIEIDDWKQQPQVKAFLTGEALRKAKVTLAKGKEIAVNELLTILPTLPPAFQQAIMMVMQGGGQAGGGVPGQPGPGAMPGMRPPPGGVMAAPGVNAVPGAPTPTPGAVRGRVVKPSGIRQGAGPMTKARPRGSR